MNLVSKKTLVVLAVVSMSMGGIMAQTPKDNDYNKDFREAYTLYERGMYSEAILRFEEIHAKYADAETEGYAVLCAAELHAPGYQNQMENYAEKNPAASILPRIYYRHALNLFDQEDYYNAALFFEKIDDSRISRKNRTEYLFKRAYSYFQLKEYDAALNWFHKVDLLSNNTFSAPARYATGYICYERRQFDEAVRYFRKSVRDPRFEEISKYYIAECKFMLKDYQYVVENAESLYASIPEERKPHLARIISESYLVLDRPEEAMKYYNTFRNQKAESREDLFYAGSLLYSMKDYEGAIGKFSEMKDRTDSLGQIANYQMGFSYIKSKNKVAAMKPFQEAAEVEFDKEIQEDAFFNYAKLCFDLNKDGSVFKDYMKKYNTVAKNDLIYSYIALAALYDHDYAAAVEAYDQIDEMDNDMRNNYMRANYLRAKQLISNGACRDAVFCLKTVIYYSSKYSTIHQLAKYWLGEAYFRDGKFEEAKSVFNELYNLSALEGKQEGGLISYNIAYCFFNLQNYDLASKWFNIYAGSRNAANKKDAMVRVADCDFVKKDYKKAASSYESAIAVDNDFDDIYPYYQAAISYGLTRDMDKKINVLSNVKRAEPTSQLYPEAMYELARTYADNKMDDAAVDCYNMIIRAGLDSISTAKALLGIGIVERNRSNYPAALSHYKRVVTSMPHSEYAEDALLAIEAIYQTTQEPEQYLNYIESIGSASQKTETDKEQILFNSAEQIFMAGNYQKALTTLDGLVEKYPDSQNMARVDFYRAECYKNLGKKEQACDLYLKAMHGEDGSFAELAALNYARLAYSMEHYAEAYQGYLQLEKIAKIASNKEMALLGLMSSAYLSKDYENAVHWADNLAAATDGDTRLEAEFIKAKSLLAVSRRDEAFKLFKQLAKYPSTDEGAESAFLVIQDNYDRGDFQTVEKLVFKLGDEAKGQKYWMAKAFIVLGDSYVEKGEFEQARATFESVRDGYVSRGDGDEVLDNVTMRLRKLTEMGK